MSLIARATHTSDAPKGSEWRQEQRLTHDVRQSLAVVMALASLVDRAPVRCTAVLGHLEKIRREIEWMQTALLHMHREDEEPVDVGEVVTEVWTSTAACVTCSFHLTRARHTVANVDANGLRRSVRNLVTNALRAAGPSGRVELRVFPDGDSVVIEVADDGPGFGRIPSQHGLGLVTVRRFAAAAQGRLVVDSSLLGGALVRLELPRIDGTPASTGALA